MLSHESHAKEVKLFGVASLFLQRYRDNAQRLYVEDLQLKVHRDAWGFALGWRARQHLPDLRLGSARHAPRPDEPWPDDYVHRAVQVGAKPDHRQLQCNRRAVDDSLFFSDLNEYLETPVIMSDGRLT